MVKTKGNRCVTTVWASHCETALLCIGQTQAAYEDKLEKLRHKQNASVRTQMELRIRDLESEFSKMKNQVDCNQIEMENYKQLYLQEVKIRKSLSNKLSK